MIERSKLTEVVIETICKYSVMTIKVIEDHIFNLYSVKYKDEDKVSKEIKLILIDLFERRKIDLGYRSYGILVTRLPTFK